jgi:hypothetical protein
MWNNFLTGASSSADIPMEDGGILAVQAILELAALLGGAGSSKLAAVDRIEKDSVAAWSQTAAVKHPAKAMLALPVLCPPYCDPTSIMIADPCSLEYELEEDNFAALQQQDAHEPVKPGRVRFQNTVTVVSIPSHRDMARHSYERIWTSLDEIQRQARRNAKEFRHDGKDWRNAPEEQDMIHDPESGECIHPATWTTLQLLKQHKEQQKAALQQRVQDEWSRLAAMEQHYRRKKQLLQKMRDRRKWHQAAAEGATECYTNQTY